MTEGRGAKSWTGRSRAVPAIVAAALILAGSGCAGSDASDPGVERIDSAGVTLVLHDGEDRPLDVTPAVDFILGGADAGGPESFFEVGAYSVAVGPEGQLAVLDGEAHRVVVFGADGSHLRTVGREGEGPGELEWPSTLAYLSDGRILVYDIGKRDFVVYGADEGPAEARAVPDWFRGGALAAVGDSGTLLVTRRARDAGVRELVRVEPSGDTAVVATAPLSEGKAVRFESCGISISGMGPVFEPGLRWASEGNHVAVAAGDGYRIDLYRGDSLVRSVRRDVPPREATRELAIEELGEGMVIGVGGQDRVCESEEAVEQRGFAETVPVVVAIRITPDGELWVRRKVIGDESGPIDLFGPDGVYRGTLPPEAPFPVAFLPDGRLVWTDTDEFDVDRLVVGRLEGLR